MKVHHLNCATFCPQAKALVEGEGSVFEKGHMVCHVLLIETNEGLVLVDAALGRADCERPKERLGATFATMVGAKLDIAECASSHVVRLGYGVEDVRHIVLTHLDLDHAGGISDFPKAKIHLHRREHQAGMERATYFEKNRYRSEQWAHNPDWKLYEPSGERWLGFDAVKNLEGLPPEILLIPLAGHTHGHSGVAVDTGHGWLLHAGDAYFYRGEMDPERPRVPGGLGMFQRIVAIDNDARVANQLKLRELGRNNLDVKIFCAHDAKELATLAS